MLTFRRLVLVTSMVAVATLATTACHKRPAPSGDVTADWFVEHKKELSSVREMLAADHGLVTSVSVAFGGLHDAGGANGSCGSQLRGTGFPWKCSGGRVAKSIGEVEEILGVPKGRLHAYERALPTSSVGSGGSCDPPGSFVFWLEDPDSSPCTGLSNIVWSPAPPVRKTGGNCERTVATHYVPLGDGWYEDACVEQRK